MAKKKRPCATCGKKLSSFDGTYMYDMAKGRSVFVCRDDRLCQKPYVKVHAKGGEQT
ncbi:hypothetical protein SCACP_21690 [Sporomusa carbonis]